MEVILASVAQAQLKVQQKQSKISAPQLNETDSVQERKCGLESAGAEARGVPSSEREMSPHLNRIATPHAKTPKSGSNFPFLQKGKTVNMDLENVPEVAKTGEKLGVCFAALTPQLKYNNDIICDQYSSVGFVTVALFTVL